MERAGDGGPVRVAVIGLGIGKTHADRYARLPGAELVAVCDLDGRLAGRVAGEHGRAGSSKAAQPCSPATRPASRRARSHTATSSAPGSRA